MGTDATAVADTHLPLDHRIGADLDVNAEFRGRIDDSGRVNHNQRPGATISSAMAARLPSTTASVANFQTSRR